MEFGGLLGICEFGFDAHAVDWDRKFLSETGYRSFLVGHETDCTGGFPPVNEAVRDIIENYIKNDLKGKLVEIQPQYRERNKPQEPAP